MSDEYTDISEPYDFPRPSTGTIHSIQFKRKRGEKLRRMFIDGNPLEDQHGKPMYEGSFWNINALCKALDAGDALLEADFESDEGDIPDPPEPQIKMPAGPHCITDASALDIAAKILAMSEPTRRDTIKNMVILMHDAERTGAMLRNTLELQANAMMAGVN